MNPADLTFQRLDADQPPGIHPPKHVGDVGYDLVAMESVTLGPNEQKDIPVNARVRLPPGTWGEIRGRSSIARRNLQVDAGTLDNGYRGPLFVLMRNMNMPELRTNIVDNRTEYRDRPGVTIEKGERVGQLVLHVMHSDPLILQEGEVLMDTPRGVQGFGSTGQF